MLKSLTYLQIINCKKLERLPNEHGNLEALCVLRVKRAAIREVPESLSQLALLSELELKNCSELEYISSSIFKLKSLGGIQISNCSNLKGFPKIPSCNIDGSTGIERPCSCGLRLKNCSSLESFPSSLCILKSLRSLQIIDCKKFERLLDELGNLETLLVLRVEGAAIRELSQSLGQLALLYELELKNSSEFEYLRVLRVEGAAIRELPESIDKSTLLSELELKNCSELKLKSLRRIKMSKCSNLKRFPKIASCNKVGITGIKRLSSTLRLKNCSSLESLPSSLCMLKSLRFLETIACKKLERLPESLGQLALLCELKMIKCSSFESLPSSLCMLKSLTSLAIIDCKIFKRLPNELGNLKCLAALIVKGTAIREVPESLGYLSSLAKLELSNNNLKRSPESLYQLSSLKYLKPFENNSDRIPEYLRSSPTSIPSELRSLNLSVDSGNSLTLDLNKLSEIVKEGWMKQSFHGQSWIKSMYFPGNEIPKWFRHQTFPVSDCFRHESVEDD
ncbi:hypothetical protein WN944_015381 [Citrus x changshan-huyou]|uniref:Disease resistance protein RPS4B/Roq1-like leucine-rich repeats domain-containing protein n=1 Tax=Citrus x changshan-huyou TaxID=2935761 RepID=A0AAP0MCF1_9ROSI